VRSLWCGSISFFSFCRSYLFVFLIRFSSFLIRPFLSCRLPPPCMDSRTSAENLSLDLPPVGLSMKILLHSIDIPLPAHNNLPLLLNYHSGVRFPASTNLPPLSLFLRYSSSRTSSSAVALVLIIFFFFVFLAFWRSNLSPNHIAFHVIMVILILAPFFLFVSDMSMYLSVAIPPSRVYLASLTKLLCLQTQ